MTSKTAFFLIIFLGLAAPIFSADTYQTNFSPSESFGDKDKEAGCQVATELGAGRITYNQLTPEQRLAVNYLKTNWPGEYDRCYNMQHYGQSSSKSGRSSYRQPRYEATVVQVVDGNSVMFETGERVELIGIKVPEGEPGVGAAAVLKELVLNKTVSIQYDVEKKDRYGRLLAYFFLEDGTFVNRAMIEKGAAALDIVPPNLMYRAKLLGEDESYPEDEEGRYFNQIKNQQQHMMMSVWGIFILGFAAIAGIKLWNWVRRNR